MKKLLLGSILAIFACVSTLQAGEDSTKAKAVSTVKAASTCEAKGGCCADKTVMVKKADTSVRGATLLVRR
jgi:hypothetical protein